MGKSNNVFNKLKKVYQREKKLYDFLKEYEIQILENINHDFIEQFITDFSNFIKNSIQLISCSIQIQSCKSSEENIKNLNYCNIIEVFPYKNQSFIVFSYNFLSIIIDLLFGGQGHFKDKIYTNINVTSTEFFINQKIITCITNIFSDVYKKYFSLEIKFIDIKKFISFTKPILNDNTLYLTQCFNFYINNIEVCFSILIPLSILKEINKNIIISIKNDYKKIYINNKSKSEITFNKIYDVKLNITTRIMDISISRDKFYSLSVGDILPINNPNKVIGYIEKRPIFLGNYRRFREQSIVFIEEFIDSNLKSNKDKEYSNE